MCVSVLVERSGGRRALQRRNAPMTLPQAQASLLTIRHISSEEEAPVEPSLPLAGFASVGKKAAAPEERCCCA